MDTLSRHTGTHHLELEGHVIVQQKRLSRKYSMATYAPGKAKGRDAKPATNDVWEDRGRPFRFHYRINVYRKVLN